MCQKLPYRNPRVDACLGDTLKSIRAAGFVPVASCCGHDRYPMTVVVKCPDGLVMEYFSKVLLQRKKRNRYYTRDSKGYYYIAACVEESEP
jgi:hypothetical protein